MSVRPAQPATTLEVVCALIRQNGRLLLARRADNGLWELPGGKIEPGESPAAALAREIAEELGVRVAVEGLYGQVRQPHQGQRLRLRAFNCRVLQGTPRALEHRELAWVSPQDLDGITLAPADRALLQAAEPAGGPKHPPTA